MIVCLCLVWNNHQYAIAPHSSDMLACDGVSEMPKIRILSAISMLLVATLAFCALAQGNPPNPWPFPDEPRTALGVRATGGFEDYVITVGSTVLVDGGIGLGLNGNVWYGWDPFFVRSRTGLDLLPRFGATQQFAAGLDYAWWALIAEARTRIIPLEFISAGVWLDLSPRPWVFGEVPILRIEGDLRAGPQWRPADGFTVDTVGALDVRAGLQIPVSDTRSFDLVVGTELDTAARWPGGFDFVDWNFNLVAVTEVPWVEGPDAGMLCSLRATLSWFPTVVVFVDLRLDVKLGLLYAYVSAGAGTTGFGLELGAEVTWASGS